MRVKTDKWKVFEALEYKALDLELSNKIGFPRCDMTKASRDEDMVEKTIRALSAITNSWWEWREIALSNIKIKSEEYLDSLMRSKMDIGMSLVEELAGHNLKGMLVIHERFMIYDIQFASLEEMRNNTSGDLCKDILSAKILSGYKRGVIEGFAILMDDRLVEYQSELYPNATYPMPDGDQLQIYIMEILRDYFFEKYAETQVKVVNKKSTYKKPNSPFPIVDNKSNFDIQYYDCTWFTTIIRNEPFGVRGHFRLQPYKNEDGEWTKKFVYIKPYKKSGVIRKAKKLNN